MSRQLKALNVPVDVTPVVWWLVEVNVVSDINCCSYHSTNRTQDNFHATASGGSHRNGNTNSDA
jgi:hypothetical protein